MLSGAPQLAGVCARSDVHSNYSSFGGGGSGDGANARVTPRPRDIIPAPHPTYAVVSNILHR